MILYANGCSHTAAAEAVIPDAFALDDGKYGIDRRPHPTNLAASWCSHVANALGAKLVCEAESGGSNPRILRTTREWIKNNPDESKDAFVILQWTTWEREEWLFGDRWYQVNASGLDWVPDDLKHRYKEFIASVDWHVKTQQAHQDIWDLHLELKDQQIRHVFFSGHSTFSDIQNRYDWSKSYMNPYSREDSYYNWLKNNGGVTATPESYHFDANSHCIWAKHVLQYIKDNDILGPNEIPTN